MKLRHIALMASSLLVMGAAQASFTGDYAANNWTTSITNGGNGSATVSTDGSSLTLVSSNFDAFTSLIASDLSYSLSISAPVTLSFNWTYSTVDEDGSSGDPFGYAINGVFYKLSADDSWDAQSGTVSSLSLKKGDVFSFVSSSTDSIWGSSTATVSAFSVTSAVPEPEGLVLAAVGLLGMAVAGRRQGRATR